MEYVMWYLLFGALFSATVCIIAINDRLAVGKRSYDRVVIPAFVLVTVFWPAVIAARVYLYLSGR